MLDVAVVGGGVCGLALARRLSERGLDYGVLEARPRAGGRVLSRLCPVSAINVDLGPTWIWPETEPFMALLMGELGLKTFPQTDDGALMVLAEPDKPVRKLDNQLIHTGAMRLPGGMSALIDGPGQSARAPGASLVGVPGRQAAKRLSEAHDRLGPTMISVDVALKLGAFDLDIAFENEAGITCLFGRSGAGKSMTINLIAGLARPDRGRIVLDGRMLVDTEARVFVPPHRRRIGLVFQDSRLFPHLSVGQNLVFGRWFVAQSARRVAFEPVVETLGIAHLLGRRPGLLSGGEKQRVAIGRALLTSPDLLLMDEPLAALDTERKLEILPLIETLRDAFGIPIVYVSHAVDEVARLASRVVVLENGHVTAVGPVEQALGPALKGAGISRFARSSVITGKISAVDTTYGLTKISHPAGKIWLIGSAGPKGREVRIVVMSTDITLARHAEEGLSVRNALSGTVTDVEMEDDDGPFAGVSIALDGQGQLFALATRKAVDELKLAPGERIFALIKTVALDERAVALIEP